MKNLSLGVEKLSLAVTALLFAVNVAIEEREVAVAIAVAGVLFLLDYVAIKFVVRALAEKQVFTHVFHIHTGYEIARAACDNSGFTPICKTKYIWFNDRLSFRNDNNNR